MTTRVVIKTCSWPVHIRTFPMQNRDPVPEADWSDPIRIEANSEREICVHDGQDILVHELPLEPKD